MPFDPMTRKELFWASSPRDRLRMLVDDLRGEMAGWQWDFGRVLHDCGTAGCAWGYAMKRYGVPREFEASDVAAIFGIGGDESDEIFSGFFTEKGVEEITPAMVADELDTLLKAKP
jgi:hypothetical protein